MAVLPALEELVGLCPGTASVNRSSRTVHLALRVPLAHLDLLEALAVLDSLETPDLQASSLRLAQPQTLPARSALLARLANLVAKDHLVPPETTDSQEILDRVEDRDHLAHPDQLVLLEDLDSPEGPANLEAPDSLESRALLPLARRDRPANLVSLETPVDLDSPVSLEAKDPLAHPEPLASPEVLETTVSLVDLDKTELPVTTEHTALAHREPACSPAVLASRYKNSQRGMDYEQKKGKRRIKLAKAN